jgi:alkanesulfonate monooxygenase SsuD/methylene tetrahydromethanopterin reductase-like flavin-dependent oxidoreductase (luciferase family)
MREAKPHIENFVRYFLKTPPEFLLPPGYTSMSSLKRIRATKTTVSGPPLSAEALNEQGVVIIGSAATVRERLEEFKAISDFDTLLIFSQFGTLPAELTRKNLEMMASEVMPHFRERAQRAAAE